MIGGTGRTGARVSAGGSSRARAHLQGGESQSYVFRRGTTTTQGACAPLASRIDSGPLRSATLTALDTRPRIADPGDPTAPASRAMRTWGLPSTNGALMANRRQKLRRKALLRQHGCCFYCELPVWEECPLLFAAKHQIPDRHVKWLQSTAEHLVACCDGGRDRPDNIVAACLWCNCQRHRGRQHRAPKAEAYLPRVRQLVGAGKWHPVVAHRSRAAQ